jgi:hypothetical protein
MTTKAILTVTMEMYLTKKQAQDIIDADADNPKQTLDISREPKGAVTLSYTHKGKPRHLTIAEGKTTQRSNMMFYLEENS